ncbi:hypothetical protein ACJW31_02G088400 [Castanea mollissima]
MLLLGFFNMVDVQGLVNELVSKLRRRMVEGSSATARLTAELLRSVISQSKLPTTNQPAALIDAVRDVGEKLIAANPIELAVGNIVRRVLHIIREEDHSNARDAVEGFRLSVGGDNDYIVEQDHLNLSAAAQSSLCRPSLHALLERSPDSETTYFTATSEDDSEEKSKSLDQNAKSLKFRRKVISAVNDLIEDINTCHLMIAELALKHIHHKYQGHLFAKELAARGLQTTVITDSAVFAMISRVNMVIVGVHAVMANGGVIGPVGLNMVALAARKHAVPFVVVTGTHKLCPLYPNNPGVPLNEMRSPSEVLSFEQFSDCMDYRIGTGAPQLLVVNPAFDYVPPELVSLFITDIGGYCPSYMYRLIADYYSSDDVVIQQKPAS